MSTYFQTKELAEATREWCIIDADGATLGRLATEVARLLKGKHKPTYAPHVDNGDFVVVINAAKVKLSGKKSQQKRYYSHTGYIGGITERSFERLIIDKPEEVIHLAVKGMLPAGIQRDRLIRKLKVYRDSAHPHGAQQPRQVVIEGRP